MLNLTHFNEGFNVDFCFSGPRTSSDKDDQDVDAYRIPTGLPPRNNFFFEFINFKCYLIRFLINFCSFFLALPKKSTNKDSKNNFFNLS